MKNFIRFLVVVLLVVSYTSCDEIDKLTEVDFNTTLNEQLVVTIAAGENLINDTKSINMVNSDTEEYLNVIQSVKITSFTYQLINFSGDDSGTLTGDFVADGVILLSHDNMVVKQAVDAGTEFVVTNTTLLNTIASKLKAGNSVLFGLDGQSNGDGMNFTIKITIKLAVTADVL